MLIEEGKKYITRDGSFAIINKIRSDYPIDTMGYCVIGIVVKNGRSYATTWTINGFFEYGYLSADDLVGETGDNE